MECGERKSRAVNLKAETSIRQNESIGFKHYKKPRK